MAEQSLVELSARQMQTLNNRLPAGFQLQPMSSGEAHHVLPTQRRSEAEVLKMDLASASLAARAARLKRPPEFSEKQQPPVQSEAYRKLIGILRKLQRHPLAGPFMQPVDISAVPDYLDIVKEPMDLSTVESRLFNGSYSNAYEFGSDIRKIWSNAFLYNSSESEIYQAASQLSSSFESLFSDNENLILTDKGDAIEGLYKQLEALKKEIKDIKGPKAKPQQTDRPMTLQEKKLLGQSIRGLQPQYLRGLINIIKDSLPAGIHGAELEFDLDTLPPKVCRDLERYVKQCTGAPVAKQKVVQQDVDDRLETLAQAPPQMEEESSSSSSSSSSDDDVHLPGSDWGLQYPEGKGETEAFLPDFDRPL